MWGIKTLECGNGLPLTSMHFGTCWEERLLRAKCLCLAAHHTNVPCSDNEIMVGDFGCGIHAWLTIKDGNAAPRVSFKGINLISTLVWGSGRVIVGVRGWRAAEASIEAVIYDKLAYHGWIVDNTNDDDLASAVALFADYYGVPVITLDEALEMLQEDKRVGV